MSYCEHCEGQRYDRAQVLRALRATRKRLQGEPGADCREAEKVIALAIDAVRRLDIPHLEFLDESAEGQVVH